MQLSRTNRASILIAFALFTPSQGNAQPREKPLSHYKVVRWSPTSGSPFNGVNALVQSHDGYLWIGAKEGLYRFDGIRFVSFDRSQYPQLLSTRISALFEDREGALWIGTAGGGLSTLYNGRLTTRTSKQGLPSDYVKAIAEDLEGKIWVGTDGEGVCRILADTIISYNSKNSILDDRVTSLVISPDTSVWVGTFSGLFRLSNGQWRRFGRANGLSSDSILCLHETAGEVWIGTYGQGITIFRNGRFVKFGRSQGLPGNNVTGIIGDTTTGIWVTTLRGGVSRILHGRISSHPIEGADRGAYAVTIARVSDGSVWVGLQTEGLAQLRDVPFTWFSTTQDSKPNPVASVVEDHAGIIWLGTANGLERLEGGKIENTPLRQNVISVAENPNGTIWAGTLGLGLFKYEKGVATRIDINRIPAFWALYSDSRGILWAGSNKGLIRIEEGLQKIYTHNSNGLSHDDVRAICETKDSTLWVGTSYGLNELAGDTFRVFTKKPTGLSNDVIVALHADTNGDLWVGTLGGLNRMRHGVFVSFTTKDGLPDDAAGMILEDNDGYFWISSDKGLYRVSKSELNDYADGKDSALHCVTFGKEDGLINPGISGTIQPAAWKSRDGRLWFATAGGVAMVDPGDLRVNMKPPPVVIEAMTVDRKTIDIFAPVSMSYNVNEFEIDYTAPSFVKAQKLAFKYRLEGLSEDWIDAGTRRTAYFTHIPPGEYQFQVIAANENGIWNTTGATLRLAILPPFWMTWWFRSVVVLMFLSIGPAIYFRRVTQLKRKHTQQQEFAMRLIASQEAERKRIAAELHDALGQNIIIIKNRALLGKQANEEREIISEQLDEIAKTATATLDEMRKIAHNLRPVNLERFGLTETIAQTVKDVGSASGITLNADIENIDKLLSPEVEMHLFRIVQEALTNIVKHAQATTGSISIKKMNGAIQLTVCDNGRGFGTSKESHRRGFGLDDIAQRVNLIGGNLEIDSTPGKGTTMTVVLPPSEITS